MLTGQEEEAVTVMDNRDVFSKPDLPNNDLLLICDHASNDIKGFLPAGREEGLVRSNEGVDSGAADLTIALSERLECMAVFSA